VNKLGVAGLFWQRRRIHLPQQRFHRLGPRASASPTMFFGHHNMTVRGGYGIYYDREDIGAVDQLSFQSPFIPIVFFWTNSRFHHV